MFDGIPRTRRNSRVLVVDDDSRLRDVVAQTLEQEGYEVTSAADGAHALEHISESPPDLIILDVLMPRMNGRVVLEKLRAREETAKIPVLLMSAVQGIETNRSMALGAAGVLEKPFELEDLLNQVALVLYRAGNE